MIKLGDKVRILAGQRKGKTGMVTAVNGGRVTVQYGPSSYHRAVVAKKHVELAGKAR